MSTDKMALKKAATTAALAPIVFLGGLLWALSLGAMIIVFMGIISHIVGASGYEEVNWGFVIPMGLGSILTFSLLTGVATYMAYRVNE